MANNLQDSIRALLRPTDTALLTISASLVSNLSSPDLENLTGDDDERTLAVIAHKDEHELDKGGLLVLKPNPSSNKLQVVSAFPIYGEFSISMSQMHRHTLELSSHASKTVSGPPRSGFCLTIIPADKSSSNAEVATFYTHDTQRLSKLVSECKRLRDASASVQGQVKNSFGWLDVYLSNYSHISALISTPPDLRIVNRPLVERLCTASAGLPGDEEADYELIRDEWIRKEARSKSRKGRGRLKLRLGTFNVNGSFPSQDLSPWIQGNVSAKENAKGTPFIPPLERISPFSLTSFSQYPLEQSSSQRKDDQNKFGCDPKHVDEDPNPDLFVIGFQEVDLSTEALIYSVNTLREDAWCHAIFAALGEKAVQYEKLASKQLVGMLIIIIVKKSLKACFTDVKTASIGSGILGLMGNKGATAIRLKFTPPASFCEAICNEDAKTPGFLSLTFVNAHLAAFDDMMDRRNQDFHDLSQRLLFEGDVIASGRNANDSRSTNEDISISKSLNIYQCDSLFWMVNLNYRVDIPGSDLRDILADSEWEDRLNVLLSYDQLKAAISTNKAFRGFSEFPITHLPTYRFDVSFEMDSLGYDLKRRPAWTDRILHMPGPDCAALQSSYTSHPQITMSDHRPVSADFLLDFDLYNRESYESSVYQLYHGLDAMNSHERPMLAVDCSFIDLGKVHYCAPLVKKVTIQNTGKTPCAWRFIALQPHISIHPEWLKVEPMVGLLLPDEKAEISARVYVSGPTASSLNLGPREMNVTLILHTILGKDHFILITGEYQATCFGNKLSTLTRLPGPIRSLQSLEDLRPGDQSLNAPREIMRLVNRLMINPTPPKDLFLSPADEAMIDTIRECLDTGEEFPWPPAKGEPEYKASHAFAVVLLQLIRSFAEPIVPSFMHSRCSQVTSRDEAFELLDMLQPAAVNVWITVTAFLHFVCRSLDDPNYTEQIANIFTSAFLPDDYGPRSIPVSPARKRRFILQFIT